METTTHIELNQLLVDFQEECDKSINIYYNAQKLYNEQAAGFSEDMRNMLVEYIIVQLFSKWERFLENIFIAYMLGEKSINDSNVKRYVSPVDREHAYKLIQSVNQYPEWSDVEKILINARNFFENGGPFEILKTMKAELNALKKIRNSIAHISYRARKDFENLVQGKVGYLPSGITPAKFLIDHKVGKKRSDPTYCEHYIEYLKDTAAIIAEFRVEEKPIV